MRENLEAYEHKGPWQNRMILGDSLSVMNSLLEFEGLAGQVQMIYIDPPYGVKFGSNFQPFVRKRDVKHGGDEDMTREPEMVKAYRDTWELGLHSYLTYLRDRLMVAKELLHESGSVFVQISDENLHHVREVLDELFGAENFVSVITFVKTAALYGTSISSNHDYRLWYAKNSDRVKYRQLFVPKREASEEGTYSWIELPDGSCRRLTKEEMRGEIPLPESRRFRASDISGQGESASGGFEFQYAGRAWRPSPGRHWSTHRDGMKKLAEVGRIHPLTSNLSYKRYVDDFPVMPLDKLWKDTVIGTFSEKLYVVQTAALAVARCLQMSTDPGDLVLDPTCGSGTTAYVAEQWGRRWITIDTSRVPLALARQRLLTATFPYYELKSPQSGPVGGFVFKRKQNRKGEEVGGLVPHITLKSIANDELPAKSNPPPVARPRRRSATTQEEFKS